MLFAEKLLVLRKQKNMSQDNLAEVLEVSRQSISKWESGQSMPDTLKLIKISEVFDVTIDQLLKNELSIESQQPLEIEESETKIVADPEALDYIFCTECGKKNRADSCFCGYCGHPFTSYVAQDETENLTKADMELAYYKASLAMQQKELEIQREQLTEAIKQTEHQKEIIRQQKRAEARKAKCPKCGSTSLSSNKKGYGFGAGLLGASIAGPIGFLAGSIGADNVKVRCVNCGYKFLLTDRGRI